MTIHSLPEKQPSSSAIITINNNDETQPQTQDVTFIGRSLKQLKTKTELALTIAITLIIESIVLTALERLLPIADEDSYTMNFLKNMVYSLAVIASSGLVIALTTQLIAKLPHSKKTKDRTISISPTLAQAHSPTEDLKKATSASITINKPLPSANVNE